MKVTKKDVGSIALVASKGLFSLTGSISELRIVDVSESGKYVKFSTETGNPPFWRDVSDGFVEVLEIIHGNRQTA